MELSHSLQDTFILVTKYLKHKYRQYRATTNEFEVIQTSNGSVRGRKRLNIYREHGHFYSFEGIPYAKPPFGELRFRAPQPAEPWQGVLNCTHCKSRPRQFNFIAKLPDGSEDCLYVNVYAKKLSGANPLPVMVSIYGGGFQIGDAGRDVFGPDYLMQRDVVVVTFAYRVGILGFLSLDDPELNIPGNAGLKDQVLALRWVKENIHNFNGDPNNITVFGQSAGGVSTHLMMLTPQTRGLFHKAIIQSGTALCPWASAEKRDNAFKIARHFGYNGDRSDKSVYEYLNKQNSKRFAFIDFNLMTKEEKIRKLVSFFGPVVEPYVTKDCVISKPYQELLPNAWGNEIPLMIGGNSSEGLMYYSQTKRHSFLINELSDLVNIIPNDAQSCHSETELKNIGLQLKKVYFGGKQPNLNDNLLQYLELMGHNQIWQGVFRAAKAHCEYTTKMPTYFYRFDFDSESFNEYRILTCGRSQRGVCHADDLCYLFNGFMSPGPASMNSREYRCIQRVIGMWYNFALKSDPNCEEIKPIQWKPLLNFSKPIKCLNISDRIEYKVLPEWEKLTMWDGFYKQGSERKK